MLIDAYNIDEIKKLEKNDFNELIFLFKKTAHYFANKYVETKRKTLEQFRNLLSVVSMTVHDLYEKFYLNYKKEFYALEQKNAVHLLREVRFFFTDYLFDIEKRHDDIKYDESSRTFFLKQEQQSQQAQQSQYCPYCGKRADVDHSGFPYCSDCLWSEFKDLLLHEQEFEYDTST